jgi:hypothetical protein
MNRALTSTWIALSLVMMGASPALAEKQKVAILGVENVGDGIDMQAIEVAKLLTQALRGRPNFPNPYTLAPNSNKELGDEKVIKNCGSEEPPCMAAIGNDVGADVLIYGKLEKVTQNNVKGYAAHLVILNVGKKSVEKTWKEFIPNNETTSGDMQKWGKVAYAKLTGDNAGGLNVKVENPDVDKGTVYVDGKVGDKLSSGRATLTGLTEGKHHVVIEVGGFKRFEQDVTIGPGETRPDAVTLEKESGDVTPPPPCDPAVDPKCGPGPVVTPGTPGKWRKIAIGGTIGTIALAGVGVASSLILNNTGKYDAPDPNAGSYGANCSMMKKPFGCGEGKTWAALTYVGFIGAGAAAVFTGYAWFKASRESSSTPADTATGKSAKREVTIAPLVAPTVAGATVLFDW